MLTGNPVKSDSKSSSIATTASAISAEDIFASFVSLNTILATSTVMTEETALAVQLPTPLSKSSSTSIFRTLELDLFGEDNFPLPEEKPTAFSLGQAAKGMPLSSSRVAHIRPHLIADEKINVQANKRKRDEKDIPASTSKTSPSKKHKTDVAIPPTKNILQFLLSTNAEMTDVAASPDNITTITNRL